MQMPFSVCRSWFGPQRLMPQFVWPSLLHVHVGWRSSGDDVSAVESFAPDSVIDLLGYDAE
jgi:hypothetical protein